MKGLFRSKMPVPAPLIKIAVVVAGLAVFGFGGCLQAKEIVEQRGGKTKVVKYDDGTWQLLVDDKPYFIRGVLFVPVKIGESPDEATMRDWMYYDDDADGINDIAYRTWVDENADGVKGPGEKAVGDFQLLKDMGCNTIRVYHVASDNPLLGGLYKVNPGTALQFDHPVNKQLLRELYRDYGIRVVMGNFIGAWTIGSGASWDAGTDYADPAQRENIKKSVKAMVLDNKDEPYVLMWLLGNENNLGTWLKCNAVVNTEAYASLVGELADMIHGLDPDHPVAVCDGDNFNTLRQYAKYAPGIDIIGYNSYRGKYGFGHLWKEVKSIFDRPVFISECGMFAYDTRVGEDQELQLEHIQGYWQDIARNSARHFGENTGRTLKPAGNSIGGFIFDWIDRWYMDQTPSAHNPGARQWNSPDGLRHEEWFGIMSLGEGKDYLMRRKRKAYDYLKDVWAGNVLSE